MCPPWQGVCFSQTHCVCSVDKLDSLILSGYLTETPGKIELVEMNVHRRNKDKFVDKYEHHPVLEVGCLFLT